MTNTKEQEYFENWMCENKHEYDNIPIEELLKDYFQHRLKEIMPSDEEIENKAEYMQRPRNPKNNVKEEFIYGYMQGVEWLKEKLIK